MIDQVQAALDAADDWLCDHLVHAEPLRGDSPGEYLFRCKVFNELAFYVQWRSRLACPEKSPVHAIRRHILAHARGDYLELAARDPRRVLIFCSAVGYALGHGALSNGDARLARWILSPGFAWNTEWVPNRQLDLLQSRRLGGLGELMDVASVVAASSVAWPPSPFLADREAYYAFTHSVYYSWLLGQLPGECGGHSALAIEGGLCRALHEGDIDLAYELFAAAALHGLGPGPGQRNLLRRTLPSLMEEGAVHAPANTKDEAMAAFVASRAGERAWAERFHVTLVAALGLACALYRGQAHDMEEAHNDAATVDVVGAMFSSFHGRRWKAGLHAAERMLRDGVPGWSGNVFREGLGVFLTCAMDGEGVPHGLVEERMAFRRLSPGGGFEQSILEPLQRHYRVVADLLATPCAGKLAAG